MDKCGKGNVHVLTGCMVHRTCHKSQSSARKVVVRVVFSRSVQIRKDFSTSADLAGSQNIVGRDFLPRGTGIVTRRPLVGSQAVQLAQSLVLTSLLLRDRSCNSFIGSVRASPTGQTRTSLVSIFSEAIVPKSLICCGNNRGQGLKCQQCR